jgi:hypothetical protein
MSPQDKGNCREPRLQPLRTFAKALCIYLTEVLVLATICQCGRHRGRSIAARALEPIRRVNRSKEKP